MARSDCRKDQPAGKARQKSIPIADHRARAIWPTLEGEKQPRNQSLTSTLGCFHGSCLGLFGLDTLDITPHASKAHSHFVRSSVDSFGGLGCKRCLWASHLGSVSSYWADHAPMPTDRGAHLACTCFHFGM